MKLRQRSVPVAVDACADNPVVAEAVDDFVAAHHDVAAFDEVEVLEQALDAVRRAPRGDHFRSDVGFREGLRGEDAGHAEVAAGQERELMAVLVQRRVQEHVRIVVDVEQVLPERAARELEHARSAHQAHGDAAGVVVERRERRGVVAPKRGIKINFGAEILPRAATASAILGYQELVVEVHEAGRRQERRPWQPEAQADFLVLALPTRHLSLCLVPHSSI